MPANQELALLKPPQQPWSILRYAGRQRAQWHIDIDAALNCTSVLRTDPARSSMNELQHSFAPAQPMPKERNAP